MGDSMLVKTAAVNSKNSSALPLPEAKSMRKQQGFSLIEILVVLVIMGLLISIIAPNVLGRADEARVQKVFADFSAIETALRMYRLDNYAYPSSEQGLQALVDQPTLEPVPAVARYWW